jgi:enterochelin esterase-like enzyme
VIVYLPPGYSSDTSARYPVFYLLHGTPGAPQQFFTQGGIGATYDTLLAEGRIAPMILVMATGAPSFTADEEWANGVAPHHDYETFVARDVVNYVEQHFRTIADERGRAIGGPSSGGYGALNIGFHHVGEFGLIEGWSAYFEADDSTGLFGTSRALVAYNSPAVELPLVAARLRATDTAIWLYDGSGEIYQGAKRFTAALSALQVPYTWTLFPGPHDWQLWKAHLPAALTVASNYFAGEAPPPS